MHQIYMNATHTDIQSWVIFLSRLFSQVNTFYHLHILCILLNDFIKSLLQIWNFNLHVSVYLMKHLSIFIFFCRSFLVSAKLQLLSCMMFGCVNKEDAWILMGCCSCMPGLDSACRHIAALLFKLKTVIHLKLKESTAPTSMLCSWKLCKKAVHAAPFKSINFSSAKTCEPRGSL